MSNLVLKNGAQWMLVVITLPIGFILVSVVGEGQPAQQLDMDFRVGELKVRKAEYSGSSVKLEQCPPPVMPEIAVIGRSNVGKSSLINMLTGRKELALVSKTPGRGENGSPDCLSNVNVAKKRKTNVLKSHGFDITSKQNRITTS
jgi:hypothetical protein